LRSVRCTACVLEPDRFGLGDSQPAQDVGALAGGAFAREIVGHVQEVGHTIMRKGRPGLLGRGECVAESLGSTGQRC